MAPTYSARRHQRSLYLSFHRSRLDFHLSHGYVPPASPGGSIMDGPGRPSLYKPEFAEQAFELCLAGATNQDLADTFDVGHSTIDNWLQKHPEFAQSVKRGRDLADGRVAHGLYSRAIGYTYETTRVVLHRGEPISVPHTAHKPPDIHAGIFWLRNRRPQ